MAAGTATGDGLDLSDEWQDEDFPGPLPEGSPGAGAVPRLMQRRLPAPERTESCERSPNASIDLDLDALETPSGSDGFEREGETRPRRGTPGFSPRCHAHWPPATSRAAASPATGAHRGWWGAHQGSRGACWGWRGARRGSQGARRAGGEPRSVAVLPRLRKSLQAVTIIHPTWYIKALVTLARPFLRLEPSWDGSRDAAW
ncbi:bcl-2/adenovirus E1B 19 kDa-interacting protein 2-like protein [Opisthocomus hoazin]|uniref:bcl-2/adenovirus E1B 19 kDa-interacting protein 2-like protein n=1 Tax=Opisthocomus hoazin TaxID=30419 RepID=UPI003F53898D